MGEWAENRTRDGRPDRHTSSSASGRHELARWIRTEPDRRQICLARHGLRTRPVGSTIRSIRTLPGVAWLPQDPPPGSFDEQGVERSPARTYDRSPIRKLAHRGRCRAGPWASTPRTSLCLFDQPVELWLRPHVQRGDRAKNVDEFRRRCRGRPWVCSSRSTR